MRRLPGGRGVVRRPKKPWPLYTRRDTDRRDAMELSHACPIRFDSIFYINYIRRHPKDDRKYRKKPLFMMGLFVLICLRAWEHEASCLPSSRPMHRMRGSRHGDLPVLPAFPIQSQPHREARPFPRSTHSLPSKTGARLMPTMTGWAILQNSVPFLTCPSARALRSH